MPGGMDLRENGKLRRAITMNMDGTAVVSGGILGRERIIAKPGFNRWLVPPAALAIHLCIGMAYGFSVFWLPLSRSVGTATGTKVPACAAAATTFWDKTVGTLTALPLTTPMPSIFMVIALKLTVLAQIHHARRRSPRAEAC
jgi:hypothetical protein